MILNGIITDAKICTLPVATRWLFLALLIECGNNANDTITMTERQINDILTTRLGAQNALSRLQSLQLVTFDIMPLIEEKGREEKRRERKGRERNPGDEQQNLLPAELASPPDPLMHDLILIWNAHRGSMPQCKSCNPGRLAKVRKIWSQQKSEAWIETVKRMAASNFCTGKNDRGWRADFSFLLKPETWAKVNDGKYDNVRSSISTAQTRKYDKLDELRENWTAKDAAKVGGLE